MLQKWLEHHNSAKTFWTVVGLYLGLEILDIVSSYICAQLGCVELNPNMRIPGTLSFSVKASIWIKSYWTLTFFTTVAILLKWLTKNWVLMSLPFWYGIFILYPAVVNNLFIVLVSLIG